MDRLIQSLCEAIKKISTQLKPQTKPLSFLLLVGQKNQGKSALLRQSQFQEFPLLEDEHANLYYNQQGLILEFSASWMHQKPSEIKQILKQLNRCHRALKVTGIVLCVDIKTLLTTEPSQQDSYYQTQIQCLGRLKTHLDDQVKSFILLTKLDAITGFCEFYQTEHPSDLAQPLGFSLRLPQSNPSLSAVYNQRFNQLIERMGQQVIPKLHPSRSSIKRTLIREFPLQLLSLRQPIHSLLKKLSSHPFNLQAIYFTSAEQGGSSMDPLNKKIKHEYGLVLQDSFTQAINYRPFFINGALRAIQAQTKPSIIKQHASYQTLALISASITAMAVIFLGINHYKSTYWLDETSKELLAYESLIRHNEDPTNALYHLWKADNTIKRASTPLAFQAIDIFKNQLQTNKNLRFKKVLIPSLTHELEQIISSPTQTPIARYQALKIYLMLGEPEHFSNDEVTQWFEHHWLTQSATNIDKKRLLLQEVIRQPFQKFPIQAQWVNDARNYLNAIPASYFYYSLAKTSFSTEKRDISIQGLNLPTQQVPIYFTKAGFFEVLKNLPQFVQQMNSESWVLESHQALELQTMLTEAYCYDYATWWTNFLTRIRPKHFQDYAQSKQVFQTLDQYHSIQQLTKLIQTETSPELSGVGLSFNQSIANQFADVNLISQTALRSLNQTMNDLEQLIGTLSVIHDHGKTAFTLTKGRFSAQNLSDPVSALYHQSQQLPEPLASWTKQLADETWMLLISDARRYINQEWQRTVYFQYQSTIAERYPLNPSKAAEISLGDFKLFFARQGLLNQFIQFYLNPFLDTTTAEWKPKILNGYIVPIPQDTLNELIRANIISNMFFPDQTDQCKIEFTLQKISLDPVVANLNIQIGAQQLSDDQNSNASMQFQWPQANARLAVDAIDSNHYELAEQGTWAFFKLLDKVNVLTNPDDMNSLQILFEINGNSGRYLLKTTNPINPFTPGVLNGFTLNKTIV